MQVWEITGESATMPDKPLTPAQRRVQALRQQTKQAPRQVKRQKAQQQPKKAGQAVATANTQLPIV